MKGFCDCGGQGLLWSSARLTWLCQACVFKIHQHRLSSRPPRAAGGYPRGCGGGSPVTTPSRAAAPAAAARPSWPPGLPFHDPAVTAG
jgi:hypothetical protein